MPNDEELAFGGTLNRAVKVKLNTCTDNLKDEQAKTIRYNAKMTASSVHRKQIYDLKGLIVSRSESADACAFASARRCGVSGARRTLALNTKAPSLPDVALDTPGLAESTACKPPGCPQE